MKAAFLIAAPSSGSGKTTIARGLMALLVQRGFCVQPFKCGPDYIDTKFHEAVCGRPSVNLDTFMATPDHVRELFCRYTLGGAAAPEWARRPADVAVVEGMMGLFDGYDRDLGSCSEVARVLDLPVVLVVDARSAAYSMAALLQGFLYFRADVRIAGVIFNKVGSQRHQQMLREVADEVGVPCLGCIPKQAALEQGSRYLGLDFSEDTNNDELLRTLSECLDLQALLESTSGGTQKYHPWYKEVPPAVFAQTSCRILVARNAESFSFVYQETIDLLCSLGSVEFFDPEEEESGRCLAGNSGNRSAEESGICLAGEPSTLLYLPGGYPEKHLEALVRAEKTRRFVHDFAAAGGHIIAECGGMMYLCRSILTDEGEAAMCGVLPYDVSARKADRRLSLGYRRFELEGQEVRGHEFHYTQFVLPAPASVVQVMNAKGEPVATPILRSGNVLASYTHLSPEAFRVLFPLLSSC
ncbi:MAG: cobyrinate a,c-diamide synthase [Bacteroidaceae bacterium]|nr:cobyrinate a,c-diamide synthase [Bacteroidaceae bacterium]